MRLIRSELLKIRTTNTWWLFGIGVFVFTAIMLTVWIFAAQESFIELAQGFQAPPPQAEVPPEMIAQEKAAWDAQHQIHHLLIGNAAQIYTSGQFFGLMFALLLGAILVTNEFFHQTATATFLTTPQRTKVILAKLATAAIFSAFFWIFTTAISVAAGSIFFSAKGYGSQLGEWPVTRAILMNGLAYGLWGILGVGLGVLIRNQIGAVLTGAIAYVIGTQAVGVIFLIIHGLWIKKDWVLTAMVSWPSVASQVMITPEKTFPESPAWWVGALVLIGYGILFGTIGTLITRKRDIS
jgi:ABC-type transport system involved in multi-copper enzyme maturation permease subunit